jgi:hypothetical protein
MSGDVNSMAPPKTSSEFKVAFIAADVIWMALRRMCEYEGCANDLPSAISDRRLETETAFLSPPLAKDLRFV